MTEVMKRQLLSYVINGTDKGQIMKITGIIEKEDGLLFEAEYEKSRNNGDKFKEDGTLYREPIKAGYLCNDRGKVSGIVKLVEKENKKTILIESLYKGIKDNKEYDYIQETAFEITDYIDKNIRLTYKSQQGKRQNSNDRTSVSSTWYKTRLSSNKSLGDYFYNCGARCEITQQEAEYKVKKLGA